MSSITVRRMKFDFPKDLPTVFIEGEPEESYVNIALSLCLPYVEPYLIKTMRAARPLVKDAQLAADLDKFCAQEGQHYKQHEAFNAVFRGRGFEAVPKSSSTAPWPSTSTTTSPPDTSTGWGLAASPSGT